MPVRAQRPAIENVIPAASLPQSSQLCGGVVTELQRDANTPLAVSIP
jgi:hypothetical protein